MMPPHAHAVAATAASRVVDALVAHIATLMTNYAERRCLSSHAARRLRHQHATAAAAMPRCRAYYAILQLRYCFAATK